MRNSLYLINPKPDFPVYYGADVHAAFGMKPAAFIADLAITTVAALAPADFTVALCDEAIAPVDLNHPADFIGLTGKSTQLSGMLRLAEAFRQRGKIVIIGGPYASLSPEAVRPACDILVRGEMESIAPQLFADLRSGQWQREYNGDQPDLRLSPIPRWELYPNEGALQGCVQTARGCPFECEFCDVIQYVGRKQRHKATEQVIAELDKLYALGYRDIFLADDNFTAYRRRTKTLLEALVAWNKRQIDGPVRFTTQISIDAHREAELLQLCYEAGLTQVFIGIETPNAESLRESHKRQNLSGSLHAQIQRFLDFGISVMGGMIVGFDADDQTIFEHQYRFAMSTPIPVFTLGALIAPNATPLYARLAAADRLTPGSRGAEVTPWQTNIKPKQMTQQELLEGMRWLGNRLYAPQAFGERMLNFIAALGEPGPPPPAAKRKLRPIEVDSLNIISQLARAGVEEYKMFSTVMAAAAKKPSAQKHIIANFYLYMQIRTMYQQGQFWEPTLATQPQPNLTAPRLGQKLELLEPTLAV